MLLNFRAFLWLSCVILIGLCVYVFLSLSSLYHNDTKDESIRLVEFSSRVLSRYQANPDWFASGVPPSGIALSGQQFDVVFGYKNFVNQVKNSPKQSQLLLGVVRVFSLEFTSFFRLPSYTLVLPVKLNSSGDMAYVYKRVNREDSAEQVNLRVLEIIQPAIALALICIFSIVSLGMLHLSSMHSGIKLFQEWSEKIQRGEIADPPRLPSSKLNYIAFAINNSLVGIGKSLEKEQSFAAFTSHELRAPVAILSANLEMLEFIKKDLSPQEKSLIKNMDSAISDMKNYMEVFLNLASGSEHLIRSDVDVKKIVEKSVEENMKVFDSSEKELTVSLSECRFTCEEPLLYVLVNNIVRNAFQHSGAGLVNISLGDRKLIIDNTQPELVKGGNKNDRHARAGRGFGIGTKIIEQLTKRLGVEHSIQTSSTGMQVTLSFSA